MALRSRLLAPCSTLDPDDRDVAHVDIGAVVRRILLFDKYILDSVRLLETRALTDTFGVDGLMTLLAERALGVRLNDMTIGSIGQIPLSARSEGSPLPLGSFQLGHVRPADRRPYVSRCLLNVAKAGLWVKDERKLKRALAEALEPPATDALGRAATAAVLPDLSNRPLIAAAVSRGAQLALGTDLPADAVRVVAHDLGEGRFRLESNLHALCGVDSGDEHRVLEHASLAIAEVNRRFQDMQFYQALNGVLDDDLALAGLKLDAIARAIAPGVEERRFQRVVVLSGLPDVQPGCRIDVDALLHARRSRELTEFRAWLTSTDDMPDDDLRDRVLSLRARVGGFMTGVAGKSLRVLVTSGIGALPVVGPVAGVVASAVDTFVTDSLFSGNGPALFLSRYYPSLFRSSR